MNIHIHIKGNKFTRHAYLGLTKQDLYVKLSDDTTAIQWKTENTWTKTENGEVDLTSQVKKLRLSPDHGLQIIGLDGRNIMYSNTCSII